VLAGLGCLEAASLGVGLFQPLLTILRALKQNAVRHRRIGSKQEDKPMIVRVFRVVVQDGKQADFDQFFRKTALPLVQSQPGIVSVTAGVPRPETPNEFCMVMVWRDLEAMKEFVGEDWRNAHVHPDEADMVRERFIHHYELAEA
jgi:heme-degrading monooxygenase HmoA